MKTRAGKLTDVDVMPCASRRLSAVAAGGCPPLISNVTSPLLPVMSLSSGRPSWHARHYIRVLGGFQFDLIFLYFKIKHECIQYYCRGNYEIKYFLAKVNCIIPVCEERAALY